MSIVFENTVTPSPEQWRSAILGARNAMNSWDKSDSHFVDFEEWDCGHGVPDGMGNAFVIGKNDMSLMKRLVKAGSDHRKFMRMLPVTVTITAPLYWWKEFDTYKVGTVANSCSTMHKIHAKEFTLDDFSCEQLVYKYTLEQILKDLNFWRNAFLIDDDSERFKYISDRFDPEYINTNLSKKDCWWQMIQLLPSSYNQKRTVMMSYEVLANIYKSRKDHKLDEWRIGFMDWIKSLPYSELITEEFYE